MQQGLGAYSSWITACPIPLPPATFVFVKQLRCCASRNPCGMSSRFIARDVPAGKRTWDLSRQRFLGLIAGFCHLGPLPSGLQRIWRQGFRKTVGITPGRKDGRVCNEPRATHIALTSEVLSSKNAQGQRDLLTREVPSPIFCMPTHAHRSMAAAPFQMRNN